MFGESPGTSEVGCWEEFALKLSASFGEQSGPQDPPIMALLPDREDHNRGCPNSFCVCHCYDYG